MVSDLLMEFSQNVSCFVCHRTWIKYIITVKYNLFYFFLQELRNQVVAGLWQTGYYVDWMYKGMEGEGQGRESSASRDLLLALGWLIAAGTLEKLLTKRVQQLDKTLLTPTHVCAPGMPSNLKKSNAVGGNVCAMKSVCLCKCVSVY